MFILLSNIKYMVNNQKLLKFFTSTISCLDVPFIKTEVIAKLIDESFWNPEIVKEKLAEKLNIKPKDFDKQSLPVIAVLSFESIDSKMRSKDIIEFAVIEYGKNKTSVLPSDYTTGSKYRPENQWFLERTEERGMYILSELWKKVFKELNI